VVVLSEAHRFLAQRIGGAAVRVETLAPGAPRNPDLPPPRDVVLAMQSADRVLLNGMGSEPWLEKVSLPEGKVVELSRALKGMPSGVVGIAHRHGPSGALHRHAAATLPWLDLEAAALQAEEIRTALTVLRPDQAAAFEQRTEALSEELGELDRAFQATAARLRGRTFLIVGDDLAAFSHRYGMEATALAERPDGQPELFLQELDRKRGSGPGAVLLLTNPVSRQLEHQLRSRKVDVVVLKDGLGAIKGETFPIQLRYNLERLGTLLEASG
jgi:ABC-type Zn uptake system ZnuABC Zn-binding protein ZnuA